MANKLLKKCAEKGFLLDKSILAFLEETNEMIQEDFINFLCTLGINSKIISLELLIKNKDIIEKTLNTFENNHELIDVISSMGFLKIENSEKENDSNQEAVHPFKLLSAPAFIQRKVSLKDFVNHFRSRYEQLKKKLETQNFEDLTTIRKMKGSKGTFTIIAMISEKRVTKNKNIILEVEDLTGSISVLINKNKKEVYEVAKEIIPDEVIALNVSNNGNFLYCNSFIRPQVILQEKKRAEEESWIAFISDIHTGSIFFLEEPFLRFIRWINGVGSGPYSSIAKKISYLFIGGDLIDGVSHYPGQEKHLNIKTSEGQYQKLFEYLNLVRKDLQIIACSGNHDSVWVGEPQPIIPERWAHPLYTLKNLTFVPNPALVEIDYGFKILMYHGASMFHYMNELPRLRVNYGLDDASVYVEEMLKRAHLSPIHGVVDYIPCEKDPLVISKTPDIIFTGDIHRSGVAIHKNILSIAGSCWQTQTPFFEKVGIHPDPCKVVLFNLKTREVNILDFNENPKEQCSSIEEGGCFNE